MSPARSFLVRSFAASIVLFAAAATVAQAGIVTVTSGDGVSLSLDDTTGALSGIYIGTTPIQDPTVYGGLYVRDRATMLDVPPAAVNLLPNPSFEVDANTDGIPDGWDFIPNGAFLTLDPDAFDGSQAAVINDDSGGYLEARVSVAPGEKYLIQTMVKGPGRTRLRAYWYDAADSFVYAELTTSIGGSDQWKPAHFLVQAPARAITCRVRLELTSNDDLWIDMARMYLAPPAAFSPIAGTVTGGGSAATLTATVPALGLDVVAQFTAAANHVAVDVELTDTTGSDRALEAGFIAPVQPRWWFDHMLQTQLVTQKTTAELFRHSRCGSRNVNDVCPFYRSLFPFGAVSLGGDVGFAMAYDVKDGPQDVEFSYSTYTGESFIAQYRVGSAPESLAYPNIARFSLMMFRFVEADGLRGVLEQYQRATPTTFERRLPPLGGWLMWWNPGDVPNVSDFGIDIHTRENRVVEDDGLGILSYSYLGDWDYRIDLAEYPTEPSPAEAEAKIDFNATDPSAVASTIEPSRAVRVSGLHDVTGTQVFDIELSGGDWSADCGHSIDPEISDRSGQGWPSRFDLFQQIVDGDFAAATTAGGVLDGVYWRVMGSSLEGTWNHRRDHFETADYPLSFDPVGFTPALPQAFSHWEAASRFHADMLAQNLTVLSHNVNDDEFWMTSALDGFTRDVYWTTQNEDHEDLLFFRAMAGDKPLMLQLDGDFTIIDMVRSVNVGLLYGTPITPDYDSVASSYYWDQTAFVDRDRPLFRQYSALWRLQAVAGWEPRRHATLPTGFERVERWGSAAEGLLMYSLWNDTGADLVSPLTIDLTALGIDPASVIRVVDLVGGSVVPISLSATDLAIEDTVEDGGGRLYRVHFGASSSPAPVVLYAVKSLDDVALSWTDGARPVYEVLRSTSPDLAGGSLDIATSLSHDDVAAVSDVSSFYYSVE